MAIRVEVDKTMQQDDIVIKVNTLNNDIIEIKKAIEEIMAKRNNIIFYKDGTEFYLSVNKILFFETEQSIINAHTADQVYEVKYKLYELENILPSFFIRISKSTIVNVNHIYSVTRNLTSASLIEFQSTHKQVYVSRYYYKDLKIKLLEKGK